jgi:hypothetical protein
VRGPDDWSERGWLAVAAALPIALGLVHLRLGHTGDVAFFHRWYQAVSEGPAFYRDGPGLNYPIVGVLLVAGPSCLVERALGHALSLGAYTLVLKATLIAGEIALLVGASSLARALGHDRPRRLALLLYLLPSTWAGGAWFGQIDVWGTALLFAAALGLARYHAAPRAGALALALAGLVLAALTKQLTWFALPPLAAWLVHGLVRHGRRAHQLGALLAPLALHVPDLVLVLPEGHRSHLLFVLLHGSRHGELVVASGASLWSLIAPGGTPSRAVVWLGLPSETWGWLAFALAALAVAALTWRRFGPRGAVLAAALLELAMALLLTGVHERYLAHALPLAVVARGLGPPQPAGALTVAVGVLSGLFVLSTFSPWMPEAFGHPGPVALLTLAWAFALVHERLRSPRGAW